MSSTYSEDMVSAMRLWVVVPESNSKSSLDSSIRHWWNPTSGYQNPFEVSEHSQNQLNQTISQIVNIDHFVLENLKNAYIEINGKLKIFHFWEPEISLHFLVSI